jgi:hypothetical protein
MGKRDEMTRRGLKHLVTRWPSDLRLLGGMLFAAGAPQPLRMLRITSGGDHDCDHQQADADSLPAPPI